MKNSRYQSTSFSAMALLTIALLFSTCSCSPLKTVSDPKIVKRETPCVQQSRSICASTRNRAEFYDHCIEAMFPCGDEGFTLKYAKERFVKMNQDLDHIGAGLKEYLHLSEKCFQTKLERLALDTSTQRVVNPESCLDFETKAIRAMNECFREESRMCSLISSTDSADLPTLHDQLHSVVESYRLGGPYFNGTVVDLGIPEAVRECGHSELADSLISNKLHVRVTWCALYRLYSNPHGQTPDEPSEGELIERLSQKLNRSVDQFVFSGPDSLDYCPQVEGAEYSLITWFAHHEDPKLSETFLPFFDREPALYVEFLEADKEREPSQCGDGIRQAGEMCDFANNFEGCDHTCNVKYGFRCSISRLTASECVFEPDRHIERPVLCQSSSRSRARIQSLPVDRVLVENARLSHDQPADSSAMSSRTISLPLLILTALICLWLPLR